MGEQLVVPVLTSASPNAYTGASVHLRFDGALLSFAGVQSGEALNPPNGGICVSTIQVDGGDGVIAGCVVFGTYANASAGTLMRITLTPKTPAGCSNLHLFTYGPPDGGDVATGTYTLDAQSANPQQNTYGLDITVNLADGSTGCDATPSVSPTATP